MEIGLNGEHVRNPVEPDTKLDLDCNVVVQIVNQNKRSAIVKIEITTIAIPAFKNVQLGTDGVLVYHIHVQLNDRDCEHVYNL